MDCMAEMGWAEWMIFVFILENIVIFASYMILGYRHKQRSTGSDEDKWYGRFINSCGWGHLNMAQNMMIAFPPLLLLTHGWTAIVSMWTAINYPEE